MDTKITLSFDKEVAKRAKEFAAAHNISLSRLTEFLYRQIADKKYASLEDLPISGWVHMVSEGEIEYRKPRNRKEMKSEFFNSRK